MGDVYKRLGVGQNLVHQDDQGICIWTGKMILPEGGGGVKEEQSRNETKALEDRKPVVGSSGEDGRGSKTTNEIKDGNGDW